VSAFDPREFVEKKVGEVREIVGEGLAVAACSGGVDSTVTAFIARMALGERLIPVLLDDGFRREGEVGEAVRLLEGVGLRPEVLQASELFYERLRGLIDAEEKRGVFRDTFYTALGRFARERGAGFLVQGTIAADVVETVRGVKTQHNVLEQVGVDPSRYGFRVIEPLRELYKPQVRALAKFLGLRAVEGKMPFPGPGLMVRVVGEVTPERVEVVRKATRIVEEETQGMDYFQCFAALLPGRATGVRAGRRAYGHVIALRAVESEDAMKARAAEVPFYKLRRIAERITSEVEGVVRVLYEVTDKPPATIEFE